jgi:hypothetical protein
MRLGRVDRLRPKLRPNGTSAKRRERSSFGDEDDPDRALRLAIKDAIDRGHLERAAKLLDVLRAGSPASSVVDLSTRRERGGA